MSSLIAGEVVTLLGRRYPAFVYESWHTRQASNRLEYLPIFAFHSLHPADFEGKLKYLAANNYRTVTLDEATAWMRGEEQLPRNAVALTIDDGRTSTWTVGYPLLKRYGMTATLFIMPGYVPETGRRPTLEDVWDGRAGMGSIATEEDDDRCSLASWEEILRMHDSGIIQIESHTMLHRRVFTSARDVVGFVTPEWVKHLYDTPLLHGMNEPWTAERVMNRLGMPMYPHSPVLSVDREVCLPPDFHEATVRFVRDHGGASFFGQRGWRRKLMSIARANMPRDATSVDTRPTQLWELTRSKRAIEERLPGKLVKHLCFPHGIGSKRAMSLCAEAGYESGIWNVLDAGKTNRQGCSRYEIGRLKHDFIYRLPGDSRRSLVRILGEKIVRRLRGNTGY